MDSLIFLLEVNLIFVILYMMYFIVYKQVRIFNLLLFIFFVGVYFFWYFLVYDVILVVFFLLIQFLSVIGIVMDIGIKVVGVWNQFGFVFKKDSFVNGKENFIVDVGLMMGCFFCVGWGFGFVLVYSGIFLGK